MKKRNNPGIFLMAAALLLLVSGCGGGVPSESDGQKEASNGREKVSIALWSDQLTERYITYLSEQFPEVDFEFYIAMNSTDFYRFKYENGDLPDILTVRRFSLNDVEPWRDALMDVSDTELANSFYQSYLRNYTYSDGTVNWLPTCAEIDSIIVNKALFESKDIEVPSNYQEFVDACAALSAAGIRPFQSNFSADFTCMEILQGLSASQLMSQEAREWRRMYESGQTDQLSEEVWMPVFERMQEFITYAGITEADLEGGSTDIYDAYRNNEAAMIRGTGGEAALNSLETDSLLMPYYGETEEDNWYLTYPAFQVAANASAEESEERKQLILSIMEAMLNEEGLKRISTGQDMVSYSKGVEMELSPLLGHLQPYVDDNRLYIRLASSDMFSVSQKVVQGMITGEYPDAKTAFDAFNKEMRRDREDDPVAAHLENGYSYEFSPDGGSAAASAIMNTLREEVGTQLFIGQAANVSGDIIAGDYTETEIRFLMMNESPDILVCEMTADMLNAYLDYVLNTPGKRGSVTNESTLYVSSGFEMALKKTDTGYEVEGLTIDGEPLESGERYSVAVFGDETLMQKEALAAAGVTDYTITETTFKEYIINRLASAQKQLAEPTDYITLN